jgi:hypothetical protein
MDFTPGLFTLRVLGEEPTVVKPVANLPVYASGPKAWQRLHTKRNLTLEWLEKEWEPDVWQLQCNCGKGYQAYKLAHPPDFKDDFTWGWRLHNYVNCKLDRQHKSYHESLRYWRPDLLPSTRRVQRDATIVTSFYGKNIDRQLKCLRSWFANGFDVVSVNLDIEITELKDIFPVKFQVGEPTLLYNRPAPKISSLMRAKVNTPLKLILNSDIEMLHDCSSFLTQAPALGIRRNYFDTPMDDDIERWGIDAFLLTNEICESFPDLDFGIGQPMWDYWVPWHLEHIGVKHNWIADPLFFHKRHEIQWDNSALETGQRLIDEHYDAGEDWELWRLNRPYHNAEQRKIILERRYHQKS